MFENIRRKSETPRNGSPLSSLISDEKSVSSKPSIESTPMLQKPNVTVLTAETEFKGVLAFSGELHLHGRLEGTIDAEAGLLVIGESAIIKADVHAQDIIIHGKVQGNVFASGRVELRGKAQVYGDVRSNRFIIEDGVVFVGRSEILSERAEPAPDFSQIFTRINGKEAKTPRS